MDLTITTNNVPRDLLYWHELSDAERLELDYIDNGDERGADFFRYRGSIYDLHEFSRIERAPSSHPFSLTVWEDNDPLLAFDGYQSDSFFSGIAIRYTDNWERVVVALVMS